MIAVKMRMDHPKIIAVVNVALGVLLLLSLGFFVRNVLSAVQKKGIKPVSSARVESKKQEKKSVQEYEALFQNNPFSIPFGSLKQIASGTDQKELSDIKLVGTISGNAEYSYAVFVGKDGTQSMVKMGESVFGAGELKTVEKYRAIIQNNGKLTKITMVDILAPGAIDTLKDTKAASGPVQLVKKGEYMIDQKAVKLALDNPTQIMTDAKLIPNMTKDKQEGFILREVRKNGFYENLGMQNGDILLRVNSFNISNPENALQAFTALRGMDKVQLDIIRNNNRMTLNYQIR
jgi:type II secretion system protein C